MLLYRCCNRILAIATQGRSNHSLPIVAITNPQYKYENQREKQQKFHFCSLTLHNLTSYNKIMREEWGLYIGPNHPISLKNCNIFSLENGY